MKIQKLTRRQFLIASAVSVTAVAGGAVGMAKMAQTGSGENPDTYYISHKDSILTTFDGTLTYIRPLLTKKYGVEFADTVLAETRTEYAVLIPQLPYIGGDANELTTNLSQSAGVLAFYRVMKAHGKSVDEVGEIIYQGFGAQMADTPGWVTGVMGLLQSAGLAAYAAKKDADISQQQTYAGDWLFTYVKGDGESFDWGVDYTECGVCKFFHAQNADELTPYLCQLDFPMSHAFNMGLERTETLAQGGRRCDFRYKHGRETPAGWPPPWLKS